MNKTIYTGGDHAGYELKQHLVNTLQNPGWIVKDLGPFSEESVDYPDFAHKVAQKVEENTGSLGLLICGSANGVCMTANKHKDIRAALCWNPDIARLAREHNNANVICIPGRFVSLQEGETILKAFLDAQFEGGRHQRRVDKISEC